MDGKTKVCGIMANPVEHSYSPMMQNFFGERTGVNFAYVPLKVEPGMVEEAVKGAYAMNLAGMNTWQRADMLISIAHPDFRDELIKKAEQQRIWLPSNKR